MQKLSLSIETIPKNSNFSIDPY